MLSSCTQIECQRIDKKFVSTFGNHLGTIKGTKQERFVSLDSLTDAYLYMNSVTAIEARISDFDTPHYKNDKNFNEDVKRWEEWFKKNKCSMTFEKADSLYRVYSYGAIEY